MSDADDVAAAEFEAATAGLQRTLRVVVGQRDTWIRLFNRLDAAVNHHKRDVEAGGLADDPDERLWKARDRLLRDASVAPLYGLLAPDEKDDPAEDPDDHEDRDEVGVADGGEHKSPPRDVDAQRLRDMEAMIDRWLDLLQTIAATAALFEPGLPPRLSTFVDDVVTMVDHWERSGTGLTREESQ